MLKLLLVDDEMNVVETLAVTIPWQEIGIGEVYKAFSAAEALDILKTNAIDLVITDICMPGVDGLELIRKITWNWKNTKCILLTGYAEFEYAQKAIQNQICDYLLKPIRDEELIERVAKVVRLIHDEREANETYQRAMKALHDHLPKLKSELLNDMLQGKRTTRGQSAEKLTQLGIPVRPQDDFCLLLIRYKEQFADYDPFEMSLMKFAIGNLAEETFEEYFHVWISQDVHEYLVVLAAPKEGLCADEDTEGGGERKYHMERLANQLQLNIELYLKRSVSVLVSAWGRFPEELAKVYHNSLAIFRKRFGSEKDLPVYTIGETETAEMHSLYRLYEPPMLVHLMEAGNWNAVERKLESILEELEQSWSESAEHITEVFFSVFAAFSFIAHKSGKRLAELIGSEYARGRELAPCRTVQSLRAWIQAVLKHIERYTSSETKNARESAVRQTQKFVQAQLADNVSLQSISDYLQMHPAYLSRIYKLETGENLSDYIYRLKMERAAHLLKATTSKIYEIAVEVGYQNPNYFIKIFKKHFGSTPQDYRMNSK
ncbi:response regulator [Paenibacillus doosanensis]|uniref:response regulator n=1 Tax=Paenibacillus doosanensis TaxID=1229154 RepID=UPI00217FA1AB|nr:response regulator [Paenibacillus doosanensis]MCS7458598.1 response regulator [Paenibacillus doosanensis]